MEARARGEERTHGPARRRLAVILVAVAAGALAGWVIRLPPPSGRELIVGGAPLVPVEEASTAAPLSAGTRVLHGLDRELGNDAGPVALPDGSWWFVSDYTERVIVGGHHGTPGHRGGEVRVYERSTLRLLRSLPAMTPPGQDWSPLGIPPEGDGLIFSLGDDRLVWRPLDPVLPSETLALPPGVRPVATTPLRRGRVAVFAREAGGTERVIVGDLHRGELHAEVALETPDGPMTLSGLGWDVARERLFVLHRERITAVDLAGGETLGAADLRPLPAPAAGWTTATVSPNGSRLYLPGPGSLRVLDTATLQEVGRVDGLLQTPVVAPNGVWLADGGGGRIRLLKTSDLEEVAVLDQPGTAVLAFSADSGLLYAEVMDDEGVRQVLALRIPALEVVGQRYLAVRSTFDPAGRLLVP